MKHVSQLNDQQRNAIKAVCPVRVVSASPGTGKTATVAAMVKWWQANGIQPSAILVVTFTRKAADEMRERIERLCGDHVASAATICTLHAWAYSVMSAFPIAFGIGSNRVTLYDEDDVYDVCHELNELYKLKLTARDITKALACRARGLALPDSDSIRRMMNEYAQWCRESSAIDFVGMMTRCAKMIADQDNEVSQWARNRWRMVIVDEAQDMDEVQRKAVMAVADCMPCKPDRAAVLVGDEDQAIYTWRGSLPQVMADMAKEGQLFRLDMSYRCAKKIIRAAANLISHNWPEQREINTANTEDGNIKVALCTDTMDESESVIRWVDKLVQKGIPPTEIAVVARTRARLKEIATGLVAARIQHTFVGHRAGLYRSQAGKQVLSVVRLAVNPRDQLSFLRLRKFLHIELTEFCQLRLDASAKGVSPFMLWVDKYKHTKIEGSAEWNETTKQVLSWARGMFSGVDQQEVIGSLARLADQHRLETPRDVLQWIDRIEFAVDDAEVEGVHVGTIHSVKGLEFDNVAVVGCEQHHLPHKRAESIKEERRLMFVAITRARMNLLVTLAQTVYEGNEGVRRNPSQFIAEMYAEEQ